MATGEPTGLIAKSSLELLSAATPNGGKVSVLLEELKDAYGTEYVWQKIDLPKNTQKQPWFTAVSPNGRVPMLADSQPPASLRRLRDHGHHGLAA